METLQKTDSSLHAELLAEIQKELNMDLNKAKSTQKKDSDSDLIKVRAFILENYSRQWFDKMIAFGEID